MSFDQKITCPECGSPLANSRAKCPNCSWLTEEARIQEPATGAAASTLIKIAVLAPFALVFFFWIFGVSDENETREQKQEQDPAPMIKLPFFREKTPVNPQLTAEGIAKRYIQIFNQVFPGYRTKIREQSLETDIEVFAHPFISGLQIEFTMIMDSQTLAEWQRRKVPSISIKMSRKFTNQKFSEFTALMLKQRFGGGTTAGGTKIAPTRAFRRGKRGINHKDFSIRYKKRFETRMIEVPDPRSKSRILDEDDPTDIRKTIKKERRVFAGWDIVIKFKALRNSLARKVLEKNLQALRPVIEPTPASEPEPHEDIQNKSLIPPD